MASRVYVQLFSDSFPFFGASASSTGGARGATEKGGGPPGGPQAWEAVLHAVEDFFSSRPRPIRVGDQFKIQVYLPGGRGEGVGAESGGAPLRGNSHKGGPEGLKAEEIEVKVMRLDGEETDDLEYALVGEHTAKVVGQEGLDRDAFDSASEVTYDDLGGLKKEVQLLREFVELPLRFPDVFKQVTLQGFYGVGKTLLAKAVATECGANFLVVNGPEIMSRMAGETEANLRRVFEEASSLSPCLLFIDEIDSIATKRDKTQGDIEKRLVAQLLTLMDGIGANKNVVVLAATNRPNQLDPALRRFGRFDREIEIPIPDDVGRLEILKKKTRRMRLKSDVNLQQIAADAHGFVGADLEQLCLEAALQCLRQQLQHIDFDKDTIQPEVLQRLEVGQEHFRAALATVNPSALRERHVEVPTVRWSDIGGLEDVKRELRETVQYPVEYGSLFQEFGLQPSRGVLFYGPPGCGKTLLAKAVANECKANFISVKGPELLTMWFGESEANVRDLFDRARAAAPCIIFFDEIDSIAKKRGSGGGGSGSEASDRVINQILTEIDGIGKQKQIFIIGATNRSAAAAIAAAAGGTIAVPAAGADITALCQRAAKLAIRERIEAEKQGKKGIKQLTKRHFDLAAKDARRSVSPHVVAAYEDFKRKYEAGNGDVIAAAGPAVPPAAAPPAAAPPAAAAGADGGNGSPSPPPAA
ncbi:cell division protein 48, putative [Eimeria maxima]|uniref:Cell division protein 48, putative n=1 Tax=Eimeria maxima TaxID=5804 RepID=U6MFL9_EIMMA|nr:cell division protein 48, putative [Eimeria maxima]CDJ61259.1 cell division protein 48, putative [Eimeria maxima]